MQKHFNLKFFRGGGIFFDLKILKYYLQYNIIK